MGTSESYAQFLSGGGHCPACGHLLDIDGDCLFCIAAGVNNHNREAKLEERVRALEEALTEQMRLSAHWREMFLIQMDRTADLQKQLESWKASYKALVSALVDEGMVSEEHD